MGFVGRFAVLLGTVATSASFAAWPTWLTRARLLNKPTKETLFAIESNVPRHGSGWFEFIKAPEIRVRQPYSILTGAWPPSEIAIAIHDDAHLKEWLTEGSLWVHHIRRPTDIAWALSMFVRNALYDRGYLADRRPPPWGNRTLLLLGELIGVPSVSNVVPAIGLHLQLMNLGMDSILGHGGVQPVQRKRRRAKVNIAKSPLVERGAWVYVQDLAGNWRLFDPSHAVNNVVAEPRSSGLVAHWRAGVLRKLRRLRELKYWVLDEPVLEQRHLYAEDVEEIRRDIYSPTPLWP